MAIDIRKHIRKSFKGATETDMRNAIDDAVNEQDEVTLPGLGVFFEILWNNYSDDDRRKMLEILSNKM